MTDEKTLKEQIEEDEKNCVPGSLAHDKKCREIDLEYLKSIAMRGGCVK